LSSTQALFVENRLDLDATARLDMADLVELGCSETEAELVHASLRTVVGSPRAAPAAATPPRRGDARAARDDDGAAAAECADGAPRPPLPRRAPDAALAAVEGRIGELCDASPTRTVLCAKLASGQEKRAKFPTSKAPLSVVFHSFRLIFGRAIIPRKSLEAWMLFLERARAEHSR